MTEHLDYEGRGIELRDCKVSANPHRWLAVRYGQLPAVSTSSMTAVLPRSLPFLGENSVGGQLLKHTRDLDMEFHMRDIYLNFHTGHLPVAASA